jgi:hypothetical protein
MLSKLWTIFFVNLNEDIDHHSRSATHVCVCVLWCGVCVCVCCGVCVCVWCVCVCVVVGACGWSFTRHLQLFTITLISMDSLEPFFNKDSTLDAKTVSTLFQQVAVDDNIFHQVVFALWKNRADKAGIEILVDMLM